LRAGAMQEGAKKSVKYLTDLFDPPYAPSERDFAGGCGPNAAVRRFSERENTQTFPQKKARRPACGRREGFE